MAWTVPELRPGGIGLSNRFATFGHTLGAPSIEREATGGGTSPVDRDALFRATCGRMGTRSSKWLSLVMSVRNAYEDEQTYRSDTCALSAFRRYRPTTPAAAQQHFLPRSQVGSKRLKLSCP